MHGPWSQHNMVDNLIPGSRDILADQPEWLIENNIPSLTHSLTLTRSLA